MAEKLPYLQIYVGDWLKSSIAGCSLEAQGLWLRMMFVMHESDRYGYLCKDRLPTPPESLARRCGCTPDQYNSLLTELSAAGVTSITDDGIIFSEPMVKQAEIRNIHSNSGRLGGLLKQNSSKSLAKVKQNPEDEYENESEYENKSLGERKVVGKEGVRKFVKPTPEEASNYAKSIGFQNLDGEKFCAYYETRGWTVGKTPIKSWKAAIKTWKINNLPVQGGITNGNTRIVGSAGYEKDKYAHLRNSNAERVPEMQTSKETV